MNIETPNRTHRPDLEKTAYNQMPKGNEFIDLKLWQFDGTDLYQWRGCTQIRDFDAYYSWDDPATEVFRIDKS